MSGKNELWHAISAGLLSSWEAKLTATTSQADREIQENRNSWPGWLTVQSYSALGYTMSEFTLGLFMDEIPERISNPVIRDQIAAGKPPFVSNASSDGTTLTCDAAGAGITTMVYSWDAGLREWSEVGDLASNSTPPAGYYILVNKSDGDGILGLPSAFLTIT